tara:strand:+ start:1116 stop:2507 length:1392 start_codon:yes stop_codon:yes gene_type:complete
MDNLSEAYSAIYEAPLHPNLQKNEDNVKKRIEDQAAKNKQRDADRAKSTSEFQAHKKDVMSKGGRPVDALDSWQQKKLKKEGKYREEWETLKLLEKDDYRGTFDTWLTGLVEEGYDIERWSDEELVEAFITENDFWGSRDLVIEALLETCVDEAMMAGPRKDAMKKKEYSAKSGSDRATAFNIGTRRDVSVSDPEIKSRGGRTDKRTGEGDRGMGNAAKRRMKEEVELEEAKDKKGKGSGTKDACYHKVKARYDVWPSAYASGALSKCRKQGAKNWGNSSKKEEVDHNLDEMSMSPVNQASQRQAAQKAKQSQIAKRQLVNKIIKKDNKQDTKLQQKVAAIQMSSFSNWRDELDSLDENRMAAYNAGAGEGNEDRGISKKVADKLGRSNDESMFKMRKTGGKTNRSYEKMIRKSIPSDKPNRNKTGRGTPQNYRKGYEDPEMGRYQSKIVQGKGSIKDLDKKK